MEKIKKFVYHHRFIIGYSSGAAIFLVLLNNWIWPTPDEYLYATLAKTIAAGIQDGVSLANTNTEHVALLSALGALYAAIAHPTTLSASRIFMVLFGLGIIWLLYGMGKIIAVKPEQRSWMLWLLLLIPGFWIFSVRYMLDIPVTFAIGLIVYFLLTKKPALYVSMGLALLLLFKEYFVYLIIPLCIITYAVDAWRSHQPWWVALGQWLLRSVVICLPIVLITVLLIDFHWLPYPRLLENGLTFIFKNNFFWLNNQIVLLIDNYVHLYDPTITSISSYVEPPLVPISDVAETTVVSAPEVTESLLASDKTSTVLNSPANIIEAGFLSKLWHIYSYNLSETDLSVFVLPLTILGITVRCQQLWRSWKKRYPLIRPDVIFLLLLLVFSYLNYHEANSLIGFRLTLPIIFALLYFAYHGLSVLLHKPYRWQMAVFLITMVASLIGYWLTVKDVIYASLLATSGGLNALVSYKPYLFIAVFLGIAVGLVIYHRWHWPKKAWLLVVVVIGLFVLKFIPFYLDNRVSLQYYGYDYGLPGVTATLHPLITTDTRMCSNSNFYKQQYYADDVEIGNEDINPKFRVFTKRYLYRYATCPFTDDFLTYVRDKKINYVLVVNDDFDDSDYNNWLKIYAQQTDLFTLVSNQMLNHRVQWALYQVNQ